MKDQIPPSLSRAVLAKAVGLIHRGVVDVCPLLQSTAVMGVDVINYHGDASCRAAKAAG
jgi:hypothetical protein